jgi:L-ascorbate metabolism protein UlaG (beta-lactamase superfamily)
MFEMEYKGGNSVTLTSKKVTLCIDPRTSLVGGKDQKTVDKVEVGTEARFLVNDSDARLVVDGPGEYEVGDFTIRGVSATRHIDTPDQEQLATIYRIECGDVRVAVIGNIDANVSDEQLEQVGVIDVLVIPVGGGGYTLDAVNAASLVGRIEPKVVVPVHYADSTLRYEVPQDSLDHFLKEISAPVEETAKYKIKSASAIPASLTIVHLTRTA